MSRRAIFFGDDPNWLYWCSCDSDKAALVNSLSHKVIDIISRDHFKDTECQHVLATKEVITELDAIHSILPTVEFAGKTMYIIYIAIFLMYKRKPINYIHACMLHIGKTSFLLLHDFILVFDVQFYMYRPQLPCCTFGPTMEGMSYR